jgi:hypothetical protein
VAIAANKKELRKSYPIANKTPEQKKAALTRRPDSNKTSISPVCSCAYRA